MSNVLTAKADTISDNLAELLTIASQVSNLDSGLGTEIHRIYVDLTEGVADLRSKASVCPCDKCYCWNIDSYTDDGSTCEECFRICAGDIK